MIEKSLSVDNVFVWAVILGFFATPARLQHRVVFWGVLAALALRAVLIVVGAALLERFEYHGARPWVRDGGRRLATPLLFALIAVG